MRRRRGGAAARRRRSASSVRSAAEAPAARRLEGEPPGRNWARGQMTVVAFLAHLRAGGLAAGPRAELIAGEVTPPLRLSPLETALLLRLEVAFSGSPAEPRLSAGEARGADNGARGADSSGAAKRAHVERFAALRLGPSDLLRADLAVFPLSGAAPGGASLAPSLGGPGNSLDPRAALLLIEVARGRSSKETRLPLYALAGAKEVWLVDVARGWTEVFRSPWRGSYRSRTLWYPGEVLELRQLDGREVEPMPSP